MEKLIGLLRKDITNKIKSFLSQVAKKYSLNENEFFNMWTNETKILCDFVVMKGMRMGEKCNRVCMNGDKCSRNKTKVSEIKSKGENDMNRLEEVIEMIRDIPTDKDDDPDVIVEEVKIVPYDF